MNRTSMGDNPMPALTTLMKRLSEQMKEIGLHLHHFSIVPSTDPNGPHNAQAVVTLGTPPAEQTSDPEFDAMIEGQRKAEQDAKVEEARKELEQLNESLTDPSKGIGLDDE